LFEDDINIVLFLIGVNNEKSLLLKEMPLEILTKEQFDLHIKGFSCEDINEIFLSSFFLSRERDSSTKS
jgi:2-iminoacetate synthase ThiH